MREYIINNFIFIDFTTTNYYDFYFYDFYFKVLPTYYIYEDSVFKANLEHILPTIRG